MKGSEAGYNVEILCEILSRLPLKSLIRFKCVCKSWQSLIETDKWLIDLHNSKTIPRLLMVPFLPEFESYCTADLCLDTGEDITTTTTTQPISNKDVLVCKQVLKPINCMTCLIDKKEGEIDKGDYENHAACLYNIITQEATPWIRSTYLTEVEQWCDLSEVKVSRSYGFGFDPTTKEHKVICMWQISGWDVQKFERHGGCTFVEVDDWGYCRMCEILTLGNDTAWRRTNKVPASRNSFTSSVYANGSIYWMNADYILVFDVGSEEYRVVTDLDFIGHGAHFHLMEWDGHLAVVKNPGDHSVNLWILDDDCHKNISTKNTTSNIKWSEEIITLPLDWSFPHVWFHTILGTNYLILDCYFSVKGETPVFVRSYNRKEKNFSRVKSIEDESRSSLLQFCIGHPLHMFTTYVESLLTLQLSHRPATKAPDRSSANCERQIC